MAGMLSMKVVGAKKLMRGLTAASKRLADPTPANKAAVITYEGWVKKNFIAKGGLHDGKYKNWKPVSNKYAKWKKSKNKNPANILRLSNGMMRDWFRYADKKKGVLKSAKWYSSLHENGEGRMPQRKIFPSRKQGNTIVRPVYQAFVNKAVKGIK